MNKYTNSEVIGDIFGECLDLLNEKADKFFEYRKEYDDGGDPYKNRALIDHIVELRKSTDIIYAIETNGTFVFDNRKLNYIHNKINDITEEKLDDITDENGNYKPQTFDF